jgi:hypothetical protein
LTKIVLIVIRFHSSQFSLLGKTLRKLDAPKARTHMLSNLSLCLDFLTEEKIKLVGIGPYGMRGWEDWGWIRIGDGFGFSVGFGFGFGFGFVFGFGIGFSVGFGFGLAFGIGFGIGFWFID